MKILQQDANLMVQHRFPKPKQINSQIPWTGNGMGEGKLQRTVAKCVNVVPIKQGN